MKIITTFMILISFGLPDSDAKDGLMKDAIARKKVSSTEGGGWDDNALCALQCHNENKHGVYSYSPCVCWDDRPCDGKSVKDSGKCTNSKPLK